MKCQIHGYFCVLTIGYHKNVVVSENACSFNSPGIEKKGRDRPIKIYTKSKF